MRNCIVTGKILGSHNENVRDDTEEHDRVIAHAVKDQPAFETMDSQGPNAFPF
jgi:hypothetical protein